MIGTSKKRQHNPLIGSLRTGNLATTHDDRTGSVALTSATELGAFNPSHAIPYKDLKAQIEAKGRVFAYGPSIGNLLTLGAIPRVREASVKRKENLGKRIGYVVQPGTKGPGGSKVQYVGERKIYYSGLKVRKDMIRHDMPYIASLAIVGLLAAGCAAKNALTSDTPTQAPAIEQQDDSTDPSAPQGGVTFKNTSLELVSPEQHDYAVMPAVTDLQPYQATELSFSYHA